MRIIFMTIQKSNVKEGLYLVREIVLEVKKADDNIDMVVPVYAGRASYPV